MKEKKLLILKISLIVTLFSVFFYFVYSNLGASLAPPKRVICGTGLKQLVSYCMYYEYDEERLPTPSRWCDILQPYNQQELPSALSPLFQCPMDNAGPCSYAMNENIPADANELPADLVLLFESASGWNQTGGVDDVVTDRHGDKRPGANIAFADGHVEFVPAEDIPTLRWTVEE